jgi:hypothetical protein
MIEALIAGVAAVGNAEAELPGGTDAGDPPSQPGR